MSKAAAPARGRAGLFGGPLRSRPGEPAGAAGPARTPFVLLVVVLLGGGLITLLLLNSALNEGSFHLSRLKKETTALTDEQQALQKDVDAYSAPDALERRARELGLVPGGSPVFLGPDGKVNGVPSTAAAPPPPTPAAAN
ncbi:FtsB family cell division protein, partial [Streptomyces bambusae]|uniref:FtsB family cell division protein n=1 Tax=Streptomyces bambusae TaxID=1550616 RepID=UPI0035581AE3